MIPVRSDVRIWIATGCTDMRRGMFGLALQVQQGLKRDPHAGDLYIFRGRRGDLIKVLWHDGIGLSLYAKRLDRGRFVWPAATDGVVAITASQMACLLEAIDWRKGAPVISPIAVEAVRRIDATFEVERAVNGTTIAQRLAMRQEIAAPLVTDLEQWLRSRRAALARHNPVAGAIDYMLKDWIAFTRFLDDGRICLTNNAAERALRSVALGRKAWLFAGSDRGGERAAFMYTLIGTARLNDIDPQAWLTDVLARIADMPQNRLDELLPWNWQKPAALLKAA